MSVGEVTVSYMLRHSGTVLEQIEHRDVVLSRRDGEDVVMVARGREEAVRDGFGAVARVLDRVLRDDRLRDPVIGHVSDALPWTSWLPPDERAMFITEFVRTAVASQETGLFGPLTNLIASWKATAEIHQNPALTELLAADRGPDELVALTRPTL
ncbi:MAG TPA: hypothetical protein VK662_00590 [Acidothermaceae bacterium]|jgi:hypothetical protein|nr:hypothetical protein [Acidothermaceae bacterium]